MTSTATPASPPAASAHGLQARVTRATPGTWIGLGAGALAVGYALTIALGDDRGLQGRLTDICVLITLASMWNLLAGYAGIVSIGQQAYVGLGAYGLIVVSNELRQDIYFSIFPAALIAAVIAVPLGLIAFRLRGGYFAIGTWVIAEVVRLVVKNNRSDAIGGGTGISLDVDGYEAGSRIQSTALLGVVVAVVAVTAIALLLRSRFGLALQAVRDNEDGARGLGVEAYRTRFVVYVVAAFFTGLAGALNYLKNLNVQPDAAFSVATWTAPIIVMVVFGGLGTIEGPIIGAITYYLARQFVQDREWLSDEAFLIATGVVAIVFALFVRKGLWGSLQRVVPGLQLFGIRRRLRVSGVADDVRSA
jgi:branched-chain amino acid transport system permease protein